MSDTEELEWNDDPEALAGRMSNVENFNVDCDSRRIYLWGELDSECSKYAQFQKALHILDDVDGDIVIHMNCYGGDVESGFAVFDAIRAARNKVTIVSSGSVMSMGALILQAADRRVLTETARFMLHDGTIAISETSPSTAASKAKHYETMTTLYYRLLAERSKQPISRVRAWGQKETYMSASQAVRKRFADAVLKKGTSL